MFVCSVGENFVWVDVYIIYDVEEEVVVVIIVIVVVLSDDV